MEAYNPRLKKLILEVVDNQLTEGNPPITTETFDRLIATGYSKKTAKEKIAVAVVGQIYAILHDGQKYDEVAYEKELKAIK